jgi:hypothetical protein
VVLVVCGIVFSLARAGAEPAVFVQAGPPPSEASKAIGRAPKVESPSLNDPPSVLGTIFSFRGTANRLEVQATSADSNAGSAGPGRRLVRVQVGYYVVSGSVEFDESDFALVDGEGNRYESRPASARDTQPALGEGTINAAGSATGAVFFDIPTSASALVLAYIPAPSNNIAGRWTLSAP